MCPNLIVLWIVHSWLLLQFRVPKVDSALDFTFLIVPSVFSYVYFSVSLDCPFLIAPSISCAQGWQCSGLSILDCSFNLVCPKLTMLWIVHSWLSSLRFSLTFICQCLWIVHSWLLLQSRVSKVSSALDCPFLFAPSISCAQSWQCSGLSILDCSFNLVCPKLAVLWIVHSWLLLQFRVPKVDSALDCPFLIVVPSVFSNVYLSVSLDCPFLIAPSISCAQGWQYSGLSILDCSFNLVCPKLTVLWIVHSWLLLQSRVPKVDSALDCPFLIVVPSVFSNVYLSVSLDCPFLIALSISCAQGWQCSGLSILDCSFNLVCSKLTVLWIVHSWLLLQSRVSKVSSALDCPFLIAPSMSCAQGWQCYGLSILDCSFNLVCPKLTVLWIVHSWVSSLRFSLRFICQCPWIVHSWLLLQFRVPKVESALDFTFLIVLRFSLTFIFQFLWIVHSWLLLHSRVLKVDSALDCPFLIAVLSILDCSFNLCAQLSILDCSFNLFVMDCPSCAQSWQCSGLSVLWIVHSWLLLHSWLSSLRFSLTFICQCL